MTKMPSESKPLLTAPEKPNHYSYLKEFRVEQCPSFLQHKCTQHRPFTCFHWHFMNQRRRRPVRKRDGSFNYSADNYCTKYDETTGLCPEGDECPFLHRTAGDTERRYHLRYYKTCMCVHDTDNRGFCVKNGPHCAFAHGNHDLRPPVYDIKEIQALENPENDINGASSNGPNVLDKERNLMNEDPKWQDTNYVLSSYKTEACKRPPRLCRQGYACPQYHNSKDKRRSPRKYKYRSTPCPNVKHGEEWGEPGNCESGDQCQYCHTRTEQQFHPEIYKSTKCNDVQQAGYCPRGVFCAFAHVELGLVAEEMALAREPGAFLDCGTNLAELLSSALPQVSDKKDKPGSESSNGSGEVSESASTSSLGSNSSHSKAPGAQLTQQKPHNMMHYNSQQLSFGLSLGQEYNTDLAKHMLSLDSEVLLGSLDKEQRKHLLNYGIGRGAIPLNNTFENTVESVVGNALDELHLEELVCSMDKEMNDDAQNSISASLASSGLLGTSAPVNIPGSTMAERASIANFSPTNSPLQLQSGFLSNQRFSHSDHHMDQYLNSHMNTSTSKIGNSFNAGGGLFDFASQTMSPNNRNHNNMNSFSISPSISDLNHRGSLTEISRLREELANVSAQRIAWEERVHQARTACEAWQRETEESNRKAVVAEQQRDEALSHVKVLKTELEQLQRGSFMHAGGMPRGELRSLSLPRLKSLQAQLRADLEEVEKVLYLETATKCMKCEEHNRSVTLAPCNHYVLCDTCASTQKECPYCQTPVSSVA